MLNCSAKSSPAFCVTDEETWRVLWKGHFTDDDSLHFLCDESLHYALCGAFIRHYSFLRTGNVFTYKLRFVSNDTLKTKELCHRESRRNVINRRSNSNMLVHRNRNLDLASRVLSPDCQTLNWPNYLSLLNSLSWISNKLLTAIPSFFSV
jgi:hypothetical protein